MLAPNYGLGTFTDESAITLKHKLLPYLLASTRIQVPFKLHHCRLQITSLIQVEFTDALVRISLSLPNPPPFAAALLTVLLWLRTPQQNEDSNLRTLESFSLLSRSLVVFTQ